MKKKLLLFSMIFAVTMTTMTGCVKVVKIGEENTLTGKQEFNASDSVSDLWESAILNIEEKAIDLPRFLSEAGGDFSSLAEQYGKYSMGTSGNISYAVKGSGVVTEINQEKKAGYLVIQPDGYEGQEVIKMQIGSIYKGSSTRDTLDIVNFGDYTNQEEWAAISQNLHALIDENVVQPIQPSELQGKNIVFTGTFTADTNDELLITPISVLIK